MPIFPDNDGLSEQEHNELAELEEWQRMQEEALTEQGRRLELLRRQRALKQEKMSYPSTRAALGSQALGAMGLASLGGRNFGTTPLGSGFAMRSAPPVIELERRLNEPMDMWPTTGQASLPKDVPGGNMTPTGFEEPQALEALAAKTGVRSYRRRWAIFRPAREGWAKETVEVRLGRRGLDAHAISQFDEEDYRVLYEYIMAHLEKTVGFTTDENAEVSLQAITCAQMQDISGPGGAENSIASYRHAYFLGLRAKLDEDSSIATPKRLCEMKQNMSPETNSFIKGLPNHIQPTNPKSMYDAIRRCAHMEMAGQPSHDGHEGGRHRRERHHKLKATQPSAPTGATFITTTRTQGAATHEAILNMMTGGIGQALAKVGAKGKGKS